MIKDTEFAYAVARVRSNEYKLLSSAVIESLINAKDYKEACKLVSETGYGDIERDGEEKVLALRLKEAFELIYESAPLKSCLDFLLIKNDFHNIKALVKSMATGADVMGMLLKPSVVDTDIIRTALENKTYDEVPLGLGEVLEKAYGIITETMDGQSLEVYLDRMCIEKSVLLAKKSEDEFSIELAKLMSALSDIKIALRCQKTGKDKDFIMSALADCDMLDKDSLCEAALSGEDTLCVYAGKLGFEKLSQSIKEGYGIFEKTCDDMLVELIKPAKYKALGIAPLVAYYFAVDAEIKTLRIILSCKKNGIDIDKIRERVRVLYV